MSKENLEQFMQQVADSKELQARIGERRRRPPDDDLLPVTKLLSPRGVGQV